MRFGFIEAEIREKGQVGVAEHCGGYTASDRNREIRWPIIWYEEALKIYRLLAQKNPENYLPEVAQMLNNLGLIDSAQNRMAEARKEYEEGLKTYRKLAQKYPESYLPEVAQTLNNLGIVDSAQNRAEEARKAFEEALKTYRELEQKNPETYLPYVATTLNNLGP